MLPSLPTYDDVLAAAARLKGVAHKTPVMQSSLLNEQLQAKVSVKCENFQRMGAFKFRGGFNALAKLNDAQRRSGVVAYSSGNHAQAVALSARILQIPATIFMPHDASPAKLAASEVQITFTKGKFPGTAAKPAHGWVARAPAWTPEALP